MTVKILSVDDEVDLELLLTQFFRRKIRKGEYEFFFAHNGLEALQLLLKHPDIDIILSDINMPEMDGLTMLAKINEMRNPALKVIMVSAYGDMENIRSAMNNGAFDFATKPIDLEDLQKSIDHAVEQIEYIRASQKEHAQLRDIQSDLRIASEIQRAILPQDKSNLNLGCFEIDATMEPAKNVGGDFYDFFKIDETHLGFTMADVSGKGVPAALFMAVSRTLIKATGLRGVNTSECMKTVNDLLCQENIEEMFVTVFYGILDTETGMIEYCNAGHNPPYLLKANGQVEIIPSTGNLIVGAFGDFNYQSSTLKLDKGDAIFTFTDGVTEANNEQHELYSEARLEETLAGKQSCSCEELLKLVRQSVAEFVGEAEQSDDITMLAIKHI